MKQKVLNFLSNISVFNSYFSGMATIFTIHRVHPFENGKLFPNENMKISPEFLEKFIIALKEEGYEFISLDKLYEILQNGEKVKKLIVFTLDDGYKDNYEIAYPIFKKHHVPFTIYITTSFPNKEALLWWYVLEDILISNDKIVLGDGRVFNCKTTEEKNELFLKIREIIIRFEKNNFQARLDELFKNYQIDWKIKCEELAMSWEQIVELSKESLCTIAGHTKNHYALNQLTEIEIVNEIIDANKILEAKTGQKIWHFAYPFGSRNEINEREFGILKQLNFKTATTTRRGTIYLEHKNHLECLPRIMLTENFEIKEIGRIRRKRVVTI